MGLVDRFVDLPALLLLVAANTTPVLLGRALGTRYAARIDGKRTLPDGRPVFGPHKTWRGLIAGTLAGGVVGSLLSRGFVTGATFGVLALSGDLISSFFKRRGGCESGQSVPLLDQLPEALLPMLILREPLGLDATALLGTALLFTALDLIAAKHQA